MHTQANQKNRLVTPWGGAILIETVMIVFGIGVFAVFSVFMIAAAFLYYWMDK